MDKRDHVYAGSGVEGKQNVNKIYTPLVLKLQKNQRHKIFSIKVSWFLSKI